jgi:AraC-like DNA-binding protein
MFRILPPPVDLQPFVRFFWAARAAGPAAPERVIPDGSCELILHFGLRPRRLMEGSALPQPQAFVFGQIERAIELEIQGDIDVFGVRFQPAGVAALWGIDASTLGPRECALEDLFCGSRRLQLERMHEASPDAWPAALRARYEAVAAWLRASARRTASRPVSRAAAALTYIERSNADARSAAREIGVSRRGLERAFRIAVGLSPAAYSRLRRIDRCARELRREDAVLSALALNAGYADQAHFCREFRQIVGLSPGAYRRRLGFAPPMLGEASSAE